MTRYAALLLLTTGAFAQTDWPSYGNDPGAMRYSPLRQIDAGNVARLKPAWTFRTGKPGSEAVPIVVGGVMYLTAPDGVYALVPETGELLWKYDASPMALRGLAYWPGAGGLHSRVFAGNGPFLLALDVTTGKPAPGFGDEGRVDLKKGVLGDLKDGRYALQSPPAVFGDVVITGCSNGEGSPTAGAYGDIRGWDAKTGKLLWTFHTVPRPGEAGIGNLARGRLEEPVGHQRLGLLHDRCEARDRVRAARFADLRFLRRGSRGRRAVRQFAGGARCADRRDEMVPATGASRPVGLRSGGAAGPVRHSPRRARDSGRRADHQDGSAVRVRPRDGRAGIRHRRAARAANGGARRGDVEDAAVSGEASAAGEEYVPHGRDVRPVARPRTLLQGIVRSKSDEDRRAVHAAAARRATRCFSRARWAAGIGAACRSIRRSGCCS